MTSAILSPLVSEFETEEAEASYTTWVKAKVQASLDDPRPPVPHDQVMAEARALLASKKVITAICINVVNVVHARREFP